MNKRLELKIPEIKMTFNHKVRASDRPKVSSSTDAFEILISNWSDEIELREEFNILLLDRSNRVMGIYQVSKGGISGTVVDPKIIFSCALKCRSSSIILAHNHPSGNLNPSQADIAITKKIKSGGELLELSVLDHLIITKSEGYYSFADEMLI